MSFGFFVGGFGQLREGGGGCGGQEEVEEIPRQGKGRGPPSQVGSIGEVLSTEVVGRQVQAVVLDRLPKHCPHMAVFAHTLIGQPLRKRL